MSTRGQPRSAHRRQPILGSLFQVWVEMLWALRQAAERPKQRTQAEKAVDNAMAFPPGPRTSNSTKLFTKPSSLSLILSIAPPIPSTLWLVSRRPGQCLEEGIYRPSALTHRLHQKAITWAKAATIKSSGVIRGSISGHTGPKFHVFTVALVRLKKSTFKDLVDTDQKRTPKAKRKGGHSIQCHLELRTDCQPETISLTCTS